MENKKCGKDSCACSQESSKPNSINSGSKTKIDDSSKLIDNDEGKDLKKDPTRFGDWEVKGRAIDF